MSSFSTDHVDQEIMPFLSPSARPDVRSVAVQYFLGLTGKPDGQQFIASNEKYIKAIISVLEDEQAAIAKDAYLALVNLTTSEILSWKLLNDESFSDFLTNIIKYVLKCDSIHADIACMILSNVSRSEQCAQKIVDSMIDQHDQIGFDKVIQIFCQVNFNKDATLNYLGTFLLNLTQIHVGRHYVLDKERCVIQRLLPYTQYMDSVVRRGGVVGTLKNCCFETGMI
jgi:hypothetical protein